MAVYKPGIGPHCFCIYMQFVYVQINTGILERQSRSLLKNKAVPLSPHIMLGALSFLNQGVFSDSIINNLFLETVTRKLAEKVKS